MNQTIFKRSFSGKVQALECHTIYPEWDNIISLKRGTKIRVRIPALDKEAVATVYYIQDMGSYANWQATKSAGSYDARTFEIKARPDTPIENFLPGMSVIYLGVQK